MKARSTMRSGFVVAALLSVPLPALAQHATGAGSIFAAPVLTKWTELAGSLAGITIAYDATGSSRGQNKVLERSVDFGMSDAPMPEGVLADANLLQFPVVVGAVVCVINVPGIAADQIRLNGALLAGIYSGKIRNWNDPAIVALNPRIALPDLLIRPIWQADPAGPSFAFTQYLLATNADWRQKFGPRITKRWATGPSVATNAAMLEVMQTMPGSLGYLDYTVAVDNNIPMAQLLNRSGRYVEPNPAEFANSLNAVNWLVAPGDVVDLVNQPGDKSWPILTPIYVQIPKDPADPERSQMVRKFFDFAFSQGGSFLRRRNFVPLPPEAQDAARLVWAKVGK